ncbi:glycosyltransferase family 4 protein [Salinibacter grassmerensis]|uniref:glycosyltransferase family 4 protein n=1 Tax=Salinibacter grassmerensis TaxID=3040353 RepID=UPI0021E8BD74|nr:glycosyltransferase family 4 protein [Salinibacter grassmerensis]
MHVAITVDPMLPVPPPLYGGVERIIDLLVRGLVERGHDVTLFAHADSEVPCRHIPFPGTKSQNLVDTIRNTLTLSRLLVERPDIVHSASRLAYLTPLLPLKIPKIMNYHRIPTVQQVRKAMVLARGDSMAFTGVSEHIAERIRPHAPAYAVYNAVSMETYDYVEEVSSDDPLVFLGRIEPIKGTHRAIEVAQRTQRELIIAGNVNEGHTAYFQERVEPHLDGSQIRYVGTVDDVEKNEMLGRSVALLMPIDWEEPFGLVMAEAMACGTPVIGLRHGAVGEVVDDGTTGFVCDTVDEMVEAVGRIGTINRAACRERCETLFSQKALVDSYERVYEARITTLRS